MRRILISLLACAAMAGPAGADETGEAADQRTIPSVTVAAAEIAEVQARVPVAGTLVPRQQVQVFARVSGYELTEILAEAGDEVEAGQVLARLATDTLSAQLAQAEAEYQRALAGLGQAQNEIDSADASLTQAQSVLERARRLRAGGNNSQAALDLAIAAEANARAAAASSRDGEAVAEAALAVAEATRRIAQLNLDRTEIKAPVAGLIGARNAEIGAMSGSSPQALFTLIADGAVEMEAEVIETALRSLSVDDPAEIRVAGVGRVDGAVRLIPASVDPVTRLGLMRITLEPTSGLRTGLFASGWVITARRQSVTVPATAILSDGSGSRVQMVEDGMVRTREVRAGLLWDGKREILDGISEGQQVIARSGAFFRDGDHVRPVTGDQDHGAATAPSADTGIGRLGAASAAEPAP